MVLVLCLVSTMCFGQLNIQTHEEYANYKTVFEVKWGGIYYGEIRYILDGTYVLCGKTDNQFEKTMASIVLGKNKEQAIKSINDLQQFTKNSKNYEVGIVEGFDGKTTKIYTYSCGFGLNGLFMETDYVAGKSCVGTYMFQTQKWFDKVISAINNFQE